VCVYACMYVYLSIYISFVNFVCMYFNKLLFLFASVTMCRRFVPVRRGVMTR
jgi:hypothetical protein